MHHVTANMNIYIKSQNNVQIPLFSLFLQYLLVVTAAWLWSWKNSDKRNMAEVIVWQLKYLKCDALHAHPLP